MQTKSGPWPGASWHLARFLSRPFCMSGTQRLNLLRATHSVGVCPVDRVKIRLNAVELSYPTTGAIDLSGSPIRSIVCTMAIRQLVRYPTGVAPTTSRKRAAKRARDMPATSASRPRSQGPSGCWWMAIRAFESRLSLNPRSVPHCTSSRFTTSRKTSISTYSTSRSTAACRPGKSPKASSNNSSIPRPKPPADLSRMCMKPGRD